MERARDDVRGTESVNAGDPYRDKNGSWISIDIVRHERELREQEVAALRADIAHERELRERNELAVAENLRLQAAEYERRLEGLNHENARIQEHQGKTVPREVFDNYRGEEEKWRASVNDRLAEQRGAQIAEALGNQRRIAFLGLGLTLLALLLRFIPIAP